MFPDILTANLRITGMGTHHIIVQSSHQRNLVVENLVTVYAVKLLLPGIFGNSVMEIQSGLGSPADVKGGMYMGGAPVHNGLQLLPVIYIFKFHVLHRSAGNNHTVIFMFSNILKMHIKFINMAG